MNEGFLRSAQKGRANGVSSLARTARRFAVKVTAVSLSDKEIHNLGKCDLGHVCILLFMAIADWAREVERVSNVNEGEETVSRDIDTKTCLCRTVWQKH